MGARQPAGGFPRARGSAGQDGVCGLLMGPGIKRGLEGLSCKELGLSQDPKWQGWGSVQLRAPRC